MSGNLKDRFKILVPNVVVDDQYGHFPPVVSVPYPRDIAQGADILEYQRLQLRHLQRRQRAAALWAVNKPLGIGAVRSPPTRGRDVRVRGRVQAPIPDAAGRPRRAPWRPSQAPAGPRRGTLHLRGRPGGSGGPMASDMQGVLRPSVKREKFQDGGGRGGWQARRGYGLRRGLPQGRIPAPLRVPSQRRSGRTTGPHPALVGRVQEVSVQISKDGPRDRAARRRPSSSATKRTLRRTKRPCGCAPGAPQVTRGGAGRMRPRHGPCSPRAVPRGARRGREGRADRARRRGHRHNPREVQGEARELSRGQRRDGGRGGARPKDARRGIPDAAAP